LPSRRFNSSFRATAGYEPPPAFLTVSWVLGQFASRLDVARERYRAFVAEGVGDRPLSRVRGGIILGSEAFANEHAGGSAVGLEVPRAQRQPVRPCLEEILAGAGDQAILVAYREWGYRLREIAEHLGVHYATVSRRLARLEAASAYSSAQLVRECKT